MCVRTSSSGTASGPGPSLRTSGCRPSVRVPTVLHLDDLLSDRYRSAAFKDGNDSVLGYYGERLPGAVRGAAERAAHRALTLEGRLVHRREIAAARACTVPAMTSRTEARILRDRAGCPVVDLPMAVDTRTPGTPSEAPAGSFAFLGVLHYGPNLVALRHLRDEVIPAARARGLDLSVTAYGKGADDLRDEFPGSTGVILAGYVDGLGEALRQHRGFLSPVLSGAGVKTKVLDAMSVGLPVAATPLGVEGIPVTAGVDALVGDTTEELVEHIRALMEQPERADRIGRAGWELLRTTLSAQRVRSAWDDAVRSAVLHGPATDRPGAVPRPRA